ALVVVLSPLVVMWPIPGDFSTASSVVRLAGRFEVPIEPVPPLESRGALVYVGALAPEPLFNTSALGTEVVIERGDASRLVIPPGSDPREPNPLRASTFVYIGDIGPTQLALNDFEGNTLCIFFGNGTEVTGHGRCGLSTGVEIGWSADPVMDSWLLWSRLPEEASVVQVELPSGKTFWQRPIARTVFFYIDGVNLAGARARILDINGDPVSS
ncbi:MAG: hypothetical protein ACE5F5_08030, partial [Acidimicrobiia bacterium]